MYKIPIFNRNLVNTTRNAQKESISVLSGFEYYEDGLTLYDNKQFFTNQLVRSSWRGLDVTKNRLWNSAPFCRAGGAEIISVSLQNKEIFALVRNQADWFVIEAHGDFDGHFEFKDFQNELNDYLNWFRKLPLFLDCGDFRVVHALSLIHI